MWHKDLAIEQKIGQMLMIGFRGLTLENSHWLVELLRKGLIGGVILFEKDLQTQGTRNIESPEQLRKLTEQLKSQSPFPLFIAIDQEGGKVSRLNSKNGFVDFPSHFEIANKEDESFANEIFSQIAEVLYNSGINVNFAPVVDLMINPNNSVVVQNNRCFSSDPFLTAKFAKIFISKHNDYKILAVAKHFPGHGSSHQDSHSQWTDVSNTWKSIELKPYEILSEKKILKAVIVGHIFNKHYDPNFPASLSHLWIEQILRRQYGFNGFVFTDDLQMKSISDNFTFEETVELSLLAGSDILLFANQIDFSEDIPQKFIKTTIKLLENNKISLERINKSFGRIMNFKTDLC